SRLPKTPTRQNFLVRLCVCSVVYSSQGNQIHHHSMPFSFHSHSGQFCPGHARNTLEEMVQTAIARKMEAFAVTEHMPRDEQDFYPEEVGSYPISLASGDSRMQRESNETNTHLHELIDGFYEHAVHLREKYADQIKILVGFEGEWIRPSSLTLI